MRARLRAFVSTVKDHPVRLFVALVWPWLLWFVDKTFGDSAYKWLVRGRPGGIGIVAGVLSWLGQHLLLLNVSLFLLWLAFLFHRMWVESRPRAKAPVQPISEPTTPLYRFANEVMESAGPAPTE